MINTTIEEEIPLYLNNIKNLINKNNNNLIISTNRDINLSFMIKYNLKKEYVIKIINSLDITDFKEKVINEHKDFNHEFLYIFKKKVQLVDYNGQVKLVLIYIKFNLLDTKVILVSFHEDRYVFKENRND